MSQSTHRLLSAANTANPTVVLASNGMITGIGGYNAGTVTYLKLYDKATAPDETDAPRQTIYLAASAMFRLDFSEPLAFAKGIAYRMTTAAADDSTAAVASGAILALNIDYR